MRTHTHTHTHTHCLTPKHTCTDLRGFKWHGSDLSRGGRGSSVVGRPVLVSISKGTAAWCDLPGRDGEECTVVPNTGSKERLSEVL